MSVSDLDQSAVKTALFKLQEEHRDLDHAIQALAETGVFDQLKMARLKKKKLLLRDEIARLEDQLTPDIIA